MRKVLFFALFLIGSGSNLFAQATDNKTLQIGAVAPDFNLLGTDGKKHSLAELTGTKGFIVVFTCNSCPFSQAYENRIIELHKKYASKGIPVVAINPNDAKRSPEDSYEKMVERAKEHQYPFLYVHDAKQKTAKKYGAARTPHVFLLNANRQVVYIGAIDDNFEEPELVKEKYLENALHALLKGQSIPLTQTKAIGCGIKWKKK